MNRIYGMLKEFIAEYDKVYVSLDRFYTCIQNQDKELRMALNYPEPYQYLVKAIDRLIDENLLQPVKSAKFDNRNLRLNYRIIRKEISYDDVKMEIMKLSAPMRIDYYLSHPQEYLRDKEVIRILDSFLRIKNPDEIISINERSWQLFKDEKFLRDSDKSRAVGERILKNTGLEYSDLGCYDTYEPFFCFTRDSYKEKDVKRVLIIENKDTFWSFKKLLFEELSGYNMTHPRGEPGYLGLNAEYLLNVDIIIYGEGNKIVNSFRFTQEYDLEAKDEFMYFGDLDPEGINILYSLKNRYPDHRIYPFTECYMKMIDLSDPNDLQEIKKAQKVKMEYLEMFLESFSDEYARKIRKMMLGNKYLPQEALSFATLKEIVMG